MIALVPARGGSKRLPRKNVKPLAGKPLILWALQNAYDSEVFSEVYICTDSHEIAELAVSHTGCKHIHRPPHLATDESPDIDWIKHALGVIEYQDHKGYSVCAPCSLGHGHWEGREVALIRPTSPFLAPETLQRAKAHWDDIKGSPGLLCACVGAHAYSEWVCASCGGRRPFAGFDSMRAIRPARETAWKQWRYDSETSEIDPITSVAARKHLHSRPTQTLEDCWIQTAGFEMFWARTPLETNTIAGQRVAGFPLEHPDSLDINDQEDWWEAERHIARLALARTNSTHPCPPSPFDPPPR